MKTKKRLEYLRGELRGERISTGELLELQSLAKHIAPGDVELLEAAGVHEQETAVIFRTFKAPGERYDGEVIALFPLEPATTDGWLCSSYSRVGQHSAASPGIVRKGTRPSTPAEICDLACELRGLGYKLRGLQRFPSNAYQVRKERAK